MLSCKKPFQEKTVADLCGKCFDFTCSTHSVHRGHLSIVLNPDISSFFPVRKTPVRYLRNFWYDIQNILLCVKLNQDTWWPSGMNFCTMYKVKQETQTRKYLKHMLVILIIYDCRTCWAVFTFRAHNVHFFSYNCCDKSVFRSIVTCEKAQKVWSDVEFVTSCCSEVSACEFCFPTFCRGLKKGQLDAPVTESGKRTRLHFFPNATGKERAVLKGSVTVPINVVLTHTHKKNIVSMLVYKFITDLS